MRRLGHYDDATVPSFAALVVISTPNRVAALQALEAVVTPACDQYDAVTPDVHGLVPITVTEDQRRLLIDGYNRRSKAIKKQLATMISSLPPADSDICPFCSLDTGPDLDHYLPKDRYPEFSLHARNLVPICTPCNRRKSTKVLAQGSGDRLFLHPSSEPTGDAQVLAAELTFANSKVAASYRIDDGGVLSPGERALVKRHFRELGLAERYRHRAHSYLASVKNGIAAASLMVVERTLDRVIQGAHDGEPVNGWRPALGRAIASCRDEALDWLLA